MEHILCQVDIITQRMPRPLHPRTRTMRKLPALVPVVVHSLLQETKVSAHHPLIMVHEPHIVSQTVHPTVKNLVALSFFAVLVQCDPLCNAPILKVNVSKGRNSRTMHLGAVFIVKVAHCRV